MMDELEGRLVQSWTKNARSWTEAVRTGRIESRRLVTDQAVVDAVISCGGRRVLDVGCGEGWLARRLCEAGREVVGFDGSAELVERARELGGGSFVVLSYEAFGEDPVCMGRNFDVVVSNFSLLGKEIGFLLRALRQVVASCGRLVIQTVHPASVQDQAAGEGWREERYEPLAPLEFSAMPWYFRTFDVWTRELEGASWQLVDRREPMNLRTGEAASLILVAEETGSDVDV